MTDPASGPTGGAGPKSRPVADIIIGLFLLICAALILMTMDEGNRLGALIAVVVLGVLGLQALVSAVKNRRSWLSRLGPLP